MDARVLPESEEDSRNMGLSDRMHKEDADEAKHASVDGAQCSTSKVPRSSAVVREHRVGVL